MSETLTDVVPVILAGGSTLLGVIIAVPAVLGAHGFQLWVDKLTGNTEQALNVNSLQMEGVCTEALA